MKSLSSTSVFDSDSVVRLDENEKPKLIVVVDTEEEFDWAKTVSPNDTAVTSMANIYLVQDIFDSYGITPCYVVDYPIVSQSSGFERLQSYYKDGRCEIGAHLHPWVTPPIDEEICQWNSFPGNLNYQLEKAKLTTLSEKIQEVFGDYPRIYKAGRYGVGKNTQRILGELGFQVDLSLCPPIDYRYCSGPDFSECSAEPFWFGDENKILEIPVTGGFIGAFKDRGAEVYRLAQKMETIKLAGVLAKFNLLDRLLLSPEGFSSSEHMRLTKSLYDSGVRTFTWSFHSPSVMPGNTTYVSNKSELNAFLDSFKRYFDFFFEELNGEASSPLSLRDELLSK